MFARWGYRIPDVWSEWARLSREMDRLFFEPRTSATSGVFPPLNLYDDGESYVVRAEVPGIETKDLTLNATVNSLTISGERKRPALEERVSHHRAERGFGSFNRSITLPGEIDPDKVQASYKLGVLEVILPKAQEARPRKIEVQS